MQAGELYRLNEDTVAIELGIGWPILDLPEGAIVMVVDGSPDNRWFTNVAWQHRTVCMFKIDLRDRATLVEDFATVGAGTIDTESQGQRSPTAKQLAART
jgi:hypothetical protein